MRAILGLWRRNRSIARGAAIGIDRRRAAWPALMVAVALLLVACGGQDTPTPTAIPPTATPRPSPTIAVARSLGEVTWAKGIDPKSGAPVNPTSSFATTDKTIYAVIAAPDLPKGATLSATWTFNGAPVAIPAQTVTISHEERRSWVEFHLSWTGTGDWPDGTLKIAISVDGAEARTASVPVKRPGGALRDDVP